MNTTYNNKQVTVTATAFLLLSTGAAAYLSQPLLFALPAGLLFVFLLVQNPTALFYSLLFFIPWSGEVQFSQSLGTDVPDEPVMWLASLSAILLILYTKKREGQIKGWHFITALVMAQMLWLLFTVALSSHFILSLKYFLAKSWYLLAFVALPLLLKPGELFLRRSALVLMISMLGVTCVILLRHAAMDFTFASINKAVTPFFRNHVTYSALLVFMVPVIIAGVQTAKNRGIHVLLMVAFILVLAATYFSYARGAWLAVVAGLLSYWLLKNRWLFQSFVLAIVLMIAAVFWLKANDRYMQYAPHYNTTVFHQNFNEHLFATYQGKDISTAERFHRWVAGVRMAEDSWATGFGPSTFYQHYKSYTVPAFKTWVSKNEERSTIHNYFLLLLIEQGAIGLLLFLLFVGALFWYVQKIYHSTDNLFWKRAIAAIGAILVMQCVVNFLSDLIETDKAGPVFYLCAAALVIADRTTKLQRKT